MVQSNKNGSIVNIASISAYDGPALGIHYAASGVTVWTPCELYGSRGLYGPIIKAISLLVRCAGNPFHKATIRNGLAELIIGPHQIISNLTNQPLGGLGPFEFEAT